MPNPWPPSPTSLAMAVSTLLSAIESPQVPDETDAIAKVLKEWSFEGPQAAAPCNLILTTGGTGLSPRDVTPEATFSVVERPAPGLSELLLRESMKLEPLAALSRAAAGCRGGTLIVNLPVCCLW